MARRWHWPSRARGCRRPMGRSVAGVPRGLFHRVLRSSPVTEKPLVPARSGAFLGRKMSTPLAHPCTSGTSTIRQEAMDKNTESGFSSDPLPESLTSTSMEGTPVVCIVSLTTQQRDLSSSEGSEDMLLQGKRLPQARSTRSANASAAHLGASHRHSPSACPTRSRASMGTGTPKSTSAPPNQI